MKSFKENSNLISNFKLTIVFPNKKNNKIILKQVPVVLNNKIAEPISLSKLMIHLKHRKDLPKWALDYLRGAMLSVYDARSMVYIHVGSDPLPSEASIPQEFAEKKHLMIKVRLTEERLNQLKEEVKKNQIHEEEEEFGESEEFTRRPIRRLKEQFIGEVIQKVSEWKKISMKQKQDGTINGPEEAARIICILKKSLDDYLLQVRNGKRFGFDFHSNMNSKMGVLRKYNKKVKQERSRISGKKGRPGRKVGSSKEAMDCEFLEELGQDLGCNSTSEETHH
jgi:hypothetical protein